jgi:prepilin-type N-terminal cleavage/methylation domain-containing protein/prepilin-type processing-associated H-X9-DG protein
MKKPNAFTLIELLVVISIIAILAGLALPVLSAATQRGRAAQCSKNLSSIGGGVMMYLSDNDNRMFSLAGTASDPVLGTTSGGWPSLLQASYVKDWNSFRSPFDKPSQSRPLVTNTTVPPVPVSYGLNAKVFDTVRTRWKTPDSAVFLAAPAVDTSATGSTVQFMSNAMSNYNVNITLPTGNNLGTHRSRQLINVLFADGHVEVLNWNTYILDGTNTEQAHWDPMAQSTQLPQ